MAVQDQQLEENNRKHTIRAYMVRNNPTWGNMSAMTLVGRYKGDIIACDLCWTVVCKAWDKGYNFYQEDVTLPREGSLETGPQTTVLSVARLILWEVLEHRIFRWLSTDPKMYDLE